MDIKHNISPFLNIAIIFLKESYFYAFLTLLYTPLIMNLYITFMNNIDKKWIGWQIQHSFMSSEMFT